MLLATGCQQIPADWRAAQPPARSRGEHSYTIGMSQCNLGEPWRVQMNADIKAAADSHAELKVVFKDAQNDTLKQRAHIEEFVSAGVDLIIVSPKEAAPLTEPVAKAMDAGIPVIVLDRRVLGDEVHLLHRRGQPEDRQGGGQVDPADSWAARAGWSNSRA